MRRLLLAPLVLIQMFAVTVVLSLGGQASADMINLPLGCTLGRFSGGLDGGALFSTISVQPSGTGVFKPFLRVHNTGQGITEDGHNTDGTLANDEIAGILDPLGAVLDAG